MEIYLVGGAVRDTLMGLRVKDHDWVVVGATPQDLLDQGFVSVGRDFPVFLHPKTHEEYALARTERNTAPGYHGFAVHASPGVTLEEDLARRDLTINSIAVHVDSTRARAEFDAEPLALAAHWHASGALVDPYGGIQDIADKALRHVTPAFRDDPVRILRLARFAARFTEFHVAPETQTLMREMVQTDEVDHLVAERVWQELARGLMEALPSRMFTVLRDCGALVRLLPEVDCLWGVPQSVEHHPEVDTGAHLMLVLDMAARLNASLPVRFACLTHDLGKGTTPADVLPRHIGHEQRSVRLLKTLCERLRVPVECKELAEVVAREHGNIHRSADLNAGAIVRLLERCDAFRKPARFADILLACECDARGRLGLHDAPYPQAPRLALALQLALSVATNTIATAAQAAGASGPKIGEWIHKARVAAVTAGL
ncbi:multifunctional CCA addition/repair protein [Candidatus Aalborgicola defluviihabitans]|uniref:multifunctional CCA addition/repair protein n=1 Tax=Candidatus Aalborgicola defluviihabitans TaxID=3386187 RepID=UPI001E058C84|nr:multifunctional CCA addition/repair protein [Burkholderiales bacterium]MBK7315862.1 multifunctional CCA addition/repair protein [Burkholderiales bacterium]